MNTGRRHGLSGHFISVAESALTLASRHARENLPREVGGIIVGWREDRVVVAHDLLLIPDNRSTGNRYDRTHWLANQRLKEFMSRAQDRRLGYVGEWHSHPAPQPPSPTDLRAIRAVARDVHAPVVLVVLVAHRGGRTIQAQGCIAEQGTAGKTRLHTAQIGIH